MYRNKMDDLKQSGLSNLSNNYQFILPSRQRPILQLKQTQLQLIDCHTKNKYNILPTSCPNKLNMLKQPGSRKKYFPNNFHLKSQIKQTQLIKLGVQIPKYHDSLTTLDIEGATSNTVLPLAQKNVYYAHKMQKQLGISKVNSKNLKQQRIKTLGQYQNAGYHLPVLTKQQQLKDHGSYRRFNILTPNQFGYKEAQKNKINLKSKTGSHSNRNLSLNGHLIQQKIDMNSSSIKIQDNQRIKFQKRLKQQNQKQRSFSSVSKKTKPLQQQSYQQQKTYTNSQVQYKSKDALDHYLYQNALNQQHNPQYQYNNLYGKVSPTYLSSINGLSSNNGMRLQQYKSRSKLHPLQNSKLRLEHHKKLLQETIKSQKNFRKYLKSNKL